MDIFDIRKNQVMAEYESLITRKNIPLEGNGVYTRYANPIQIMIFLLFTILSPAAVS